MIKLHLDTDLGGDIDDLCALAMILQWPEVDLLAVTTVADDRGKRAGYARYVLDLAGRGDVAVAAGADISLQRFRPTPGLPDEETYWPEAVPPAPTALDAALASIARSIEQGATIVAIGPYTNLALLEERSPAILSRAKLVLMGGYVTPPREGFPKWDQDADWNVQVDVQAAQVVMRRANPTFVPVTATVETWLRRAYLPAMRRAGPLARLISRQAEAFARDEGMEARNGQTCARLPGDIINFLHDPLACAIALGWNDGVEISEIPLQAEIEDGLLTQRVVAGGKPTRFVTRVDGGRFSDFWLRMVTGGNAAPPATNG